MHALPPLGFGLGLRKEHFADLLAAPPAGVDWFEAISENFMVAGGKPLAVLDRVRRDLPLVLHGVSLSIGSVDPLNTEYLDRLAALIERVEPAWVSDHLCWTGVDGVNLHDLLPLPYTPECLAHVAGRVRQVQDRLARRLVLENPSTYLTATGSSLTEWEFLAALAEETDCLLLLDVNNVYVSACNHGFDPQRYLAGIPPARVVQLHIAGHSDVNGFRIDTHDASVCDAVWALYAQATQRFPGAATLLERDDAIPPLPELIAELDRARAIAARQEAA
ncbi:MNIO family bufferin maturase [Immundisolibacter sp.]